MSKSSASSSSTARRVEPNAAAGPYNAANALTASLKNSAESNVQIDAPSHTLGHSSSTQLISGTLVIQSAPSALADSNKPVPVTSGLPVNRSVKPETYKGSENAPSSDKDGHFPDSRSTRRAAKGQSREELRQAFSVFDTDGDGSITTAEFAVVFKMLGYAVTDTELNEMIAELDENGDGNISFDEFVAMMTRRAAADMSDGVDPIDDALQVFDTNDPKIVKMEVKELQHICQLLKENLTEEEMDSILKEMQPDAEGYINYARLVQADDAGKLSSCSINDSPMKQYTLYEIQRHLHLHL